MRHTRGGADQAQFGTGTPLLFAQAARFYIAGLEAHQRGQAQLLLDAFEDALGRPAPLLAYTPLTARQWQATLPPGMQAEAQELLTDLRAFLRDFGWLDAARPVNLFD